MSDESYQPRQSLGVLKMISNGISMIFQNPVLLIGVTLLVQLFWMAFNFVISFGVFGVNPFDVTAVLGAQGNAPYQIFSTILSIIGYIMTIGIVTLAAIDAHNGYGIRLGFYIKQAASKFFVILIISIVVYLIAAIPFLLGAGVSAFMQQTSAAVFMIILMLVGVGFFFYVFAMYSMTTPAILAENVGFGALGRSRFLTKSYRGSITGVFLILMAFLAIVMLLAAAAMGLFGAASAVNIQFLVQNATGSPVFQIANALVGSTLLAYFSAVNVSIFERLRVIKEGVGLVEVANVFD